MVVQVYSDPVRTRYYNTRVSCSYLVSIVSIVLIVILPLFLAYNSHCKSIPLIILFQSIHLAIAFWLRSNTYHEQPVVKYTYEMMLIAEGNTDDGSPLEIFWSTLPPHLNALVGSKLRSAEVRVSLSSIFQF